MNVVSEYLHTELSVEGCRRVVTNSLKQLQPVADRFDALAVRGVSGLTIGPILAYEMGKGLIVVRKGETRHSLCDVEGLLGPTVRYLIVDDFIASGATMREIQEQIGRRGRFVGYHLYQRDKVVWREDAEEYLVLPYEPVDEAVFSKGIP